MEYISHRGIYEQCSENTLEAFSQASKAGFAHIETDLRISSDGEIVACHDVDLIRIANLEMRVDQLSTAQLQAVKLIKGGHIPTLENIYEDFSDVCFTFDIKPETGLEVIEAIDRFLLRRPSAKPWLLEKSRFLFWNRHQERLFLDRYPNVSLYARKWEAITVGLAVMTGLSRWFPIFRGKIYSLPSTFLGIRLMKRRLVRLYHQRGVRVLAYLPREDDWEDVRQAMFDQVLVDGPLPNLVGESAQ